ncbi:MAG: TonB-dependent receptor [Gammaproteobacteria bacterium]|nr:TonB-dependent receptor [Gammaproteobacteria bacterium]
MRRTVMRFAYLPICIAAGFEIPLLAAAESTPPTETMVVTASRGASPELDTVGNIARLGGDEIRSVNSVHPHELGIRVPGVWIGRNGGQEHLTAIRSPVLTGPGSCGAFLILEDSIPTRPTGYCNVNQLFEVPTELAASVEVIRGPANALYGSNGLHGTINTLLPVPGSEPGTEVRLETGSNDYRRARILFDSGASDNAYTAGLVYDRDGGFRADTGYNQAKFFGKNLRELESGELEWLVSGSWLNQDSAGFITGENAYKGSDRFRNENVEEGVFPYRDAYSLRFATTWTPDTGAVWAPEYRFYLHNSQMKFLQFFLPGIPREKNGQTSGGFMFIARRDVGDDSRLTVGIDTEVSDGYLDEFQADVLDGPSAFLNATRPQGQHYDYDVNSYMTAGYANLTVPVSEQVEIQAGLRAEFMRYHYDNKMLDGNSRDDGTLCGFGGCIYNRPEDRDDNFFNVSPNFGVLYRKSDETSLFFNYASGFRVPQATELYRLQRGQDVADIDSERLNSLEFGMRHAREGFSIETVLFYMRKSDFIFRDSEGFNVSNGKSKHFGVETNLNWQLSDQVYLGFTGSLADHKYDFSRDAGLGEVITKGNEVDTAPDTLFSVQLGYDYGDGMAEIEFVHNDEYYMDAANTEDYNGHNLLNLRVSYEPTNDWFAALRVNNLTDEKYADRADLFSTTDEFRYWPGRKREYYVEFGWRTE